MTIHSFASDLADRIPEMARDGKFNNQRLIEQLLSEFLKEWEVQAVATYIPIRSQFDASKLSVEKISLLAPQAPEPAPQTDCSGSSL